MPIFLLAVFTGVFLGAFSHEQTPSAALINAQPETAPLQLILLDPSVGNLQPPTFISRPVPDFSQCHNAKTHAFILTLQVDEQGSPKQIASPYTGTDKCLMKAATAVAQQFRFTPAQSKGHAIASTIAVRFETEPPAAGDATPPLLVKTVEPEFPPELLGRGGNYAAAISFLVGTNGLPSNFKIVTSGGPSVDRNALAAVLRYRFWPAMKDGQPVATTLTITVSFNK